MAVKEKSRHFSLSQIIHIIFKIRHLAGISISAGPFLILKVKNQTSIDNFRHPRGENNGRKKQEGDYCAVHPFYKYWRN